MDAQKRKALKELGIDPDEITGGAEILQKKADKTPFRLKGSGTDDDGEETTDVRSLLSRLTEQMEQIKTTMKEDSEEPPEEEKLEDLMVGELTVGELQDVIARTIATKSTEPVGIALKTLFEQIEEIREILTSKSVQSVVDDVVRMKAKIERLAARTKGIGSKMRELDDMAPRVLARGRRPSRDDDTLLSELADDSEELATTKAANSDGNPMGWLETFIQNQ